MACETKSSYFVDNLGSLYMQATLLLFNQLIERNVTTIIINKEVHDMRSYGLADGIRPHVG